MKYKLIKWTLVLTLLLVSAAIYYWYNPAVNSYFPKCPFKVITGFHCPLCGSQQAIHQLLHWDWSKAIRSNLLLVLALPYIVATIVLDALPASNVRAQRWRKWLFGKPTICFLAGMVILFWIVRNIS